MGDLKKLSDPFSMEDIEWLITATTKDKTKGLAVPFITARAVQARLDEVVGPTMWKNNFTEWKTGAQLCEILIYDEALDQWIGKIDGSGDTDIEGTKGGLSSAFKRCAAMWGIGRYLYFLDGVWVEIEQQGNSYRIKPNQVITLPGWALPGGTGKPGIKDATQPTVTTRGYNAAPAPQQQPQQGAQQQAGPAPSGNGQAGKLSPKQVDRALKKGQAANQDKASILVWIEQKFGVKAIEDLNRQQYDELCAALDKARVQ